MITTPKNDDQLTTQYCHHPSAASFRLAGFSIDRVLDMFNAKVMSTRVHEPKRKLNAQNTHNVLALPESSHQWTKTERHVSKKQQQTGENLGYMYTDM